jgi:hypothetical protein
MRVRGGLTAYRNLDAGVTGAVVKASSGMCCGGIVANNAAAARFLRLYNKATAPTASDVPVFTFQLPASSIVNLVFPEYIAFSAGIGLRASTGVADADTGATTTNDVIVNLWYA